MNLPILFFYYSYRFFSFLFKNNPIPLLTIIIIHETSIFNVMYSISTTT